MSVGFERSSCSFGADKSLFNSKFFNNENFGGAIFHRLHRELSAGTRTPPPHSLSARRAWTSRSDRYRDPMFSAVSLLGRHCQDEQQPRHCRCKPVSTMVFLRLTMLLLLLL